MNEPNCETQTDAKQCEKEAARLLMTNYVERNIREFVMALIDLVPFFDEHTVGSLKGATNIVNATFATIALDVVEDLYNKDFDDPDRRLLPYSPRDMESAIRSLTGLVRSINYLGHLLDKPEDPAINTCRKAYARGYWSI